MSNFVTIGVQIPRVTPDEVAVPISEAEEVVVMTFVTTDVQITLVTPAEVDAPISEIEEVVGTPRG